MSKERAETLERLLRANDLGVLLDTDVPSRDRLFVSLSERLEKVGADYHARFGGSASFTPEALETESSRNPHKIRAFLQAMRMTRSSEMLVMVWRILQGLSVQEVNMMFQKRQSFELVVVLTEPGRQQSKSEMYKSTDIFDLRLLRHFAIATVADRPSISGFVPVRD